MTSQTLVVHDYFAIHGGGERTILTLAAALDATLMYGYRTSDTFEPAMFPPLCRDLALPLALQRPRIRLLALAAAFARKRVTVAMYPQRVFSGVVAPFAAPDQAAGGRNIFYCHTPPRFLYDQKEYFRRRDPLLPRITAGFVLPSFQGRYERAVARMDIIVANSGNVQKRIKRYLGRDSVVVYPPCDTDRFAWGGQQGFYLSTARLSDLKRVDTIVAAFLRMPDKNLVVASDGPLGRSLRAQAGDAPNIRFTGWIDEADLRKLVGEAIATIYVPIDEDFGMSPVESMAAGKPCISVAEGGPVETILAEETGILLKPDFAVEDLMEAVSRLGPQRALAMRNVCEAQAARFSRQSFVRRMRELVEGAPQPMVKGEA